MPELNEYAIIADDIIERCRKLGETQPHQVGYTCYVTTESKEVVEPVEQTARFVNSHKYPLDVVWVRRRTEVVAHPACIMGEALVELGVEPMQLADQNIPIGKLLNVMGINTNQDEMAWLHRCQAWNDRGKPWAEAVRLADKGEDPPLIPFITPPGGPLYKIVV